MNTRAMIYDIQRFSIHDGPGIRTTVFFKGCPLRCLWCANPESQNNTIELLGDEEVGYEIDIDDLIEECKKDYLFYQRSDGGITLSGGEPLLQHDFILELIDRLHQEEIKVAIETSGFEDWQNIEKIFKELDFIYYDIKAFDNKLHQGLTGVGNDLILSNLKKVAKLDKELVVRVPLIPTLNDNYDEIKNIVLFCKENNIENIELLKYHRFGVNKYKKMAREYVLEDIKEVSKKEINKLIDKIKKEIDINIYVN